MDIFNASSDREHGFHIPWYAAVPAVGSLGLAAFSLSRLPGTRRLIHSAKYYQDNLPSLNAKIHQMEAVKNRVDQMADAVRNIQKLEQSGVSNPAATPFYKKFLALGGKIQEVPLGGDSVQVEAWVPGKGGKTYDPVWLAQKAAADMADVMAKRQRFLSNINQASAARETMNAGLAGSTVLGVPVAVGMLYGNRGNWRGDKTSSLRVPSDKLSAMYQYDATTGEVVGVDIADPKDPSKVITPTIRQLAKQGYPEFKGILELDRAAGRQTYADYLASGGRYRIKFPDAESVSGGSGFFDITPGKGALGGAALGMLLGGLYADKVNNNPLWSQTQRNQAALGYRALGATGGALGGYLLGKALSD